MIAESNKIAYEYVTANGIGLSIFATSLRYMVLNQSPPVEEGDNKIHTMAIGGQLTCRLDRDWKFSLNTDINSKGVFFDLRKIGNMQNLTAYANVFASAESNVEGTLIIKGFWEEDGSFTEKKHSRSKNDLDNNEVNYYTLSQQKTSVNFLISRVFNINRKFNFSVGSGSTTGEYYYSKENHSLESFGLDPFMMPDGRSITENIYSTNYLKGYLGVSIYF